MTVMLTASRQQVNWSSGLDLNSQIFQKSILVIRIEFAKWASDHANPATTQAWLSSFFVIELASVQVDFIQVFFPYFIGSLLQEFTELHQCV